MLSIIGFMKTALMSVMLMYEDLNELLPKCSIFFLPAWVKFGVEAVHVMLLGMVGFVKISIMKSEDQISIFASVFYIVI